MNPHKIAKVEIFLTNLVTLIEALNLSTGYKRNIKMQDNWHIPKNVLQIKFTYFNCHFANSLSVFSSFSFFHYDSKNVFSWNWQLMDLNPKKCRKRTLWQLCLNHCPIDLICTYVFLIFPIRLSQKTNALHFKRNVNKARPTSKVTYKFLLIYMLTSSSSAFDWHIGLNN